jgi:membrane protease subunit HflC
VAGRVTGGDFGAKTGQCLPTRIMHTCPSSKPAANRLPSADHARSVIGTPNSFAESNSFLAHDLRSSSFPSIFPVASVSPLSQKAILVSGESCRSSQLVSTRVWASALDMQRRVYETGHTEMLTRDKKNMIARTFVIWRIGDALTFIQAIGNERAAEAKLDGLLTNAAIGTLGGHDLSALVSTNPSDLQVDQIESELLGSTAPMALRSYGVAIEQVRLERIALPEENVEAVFGQMRAERRQFAAKFEAEGDLEASKIRSEAELEAARIRAKGAEEQARIRGESAALVAKTYADAHRTDPELYRFTRSLESLGKLVTGNSSLILRTDSEPFSLLQSKGQQ